MPSVAALTPQRVASPLPHSPPGTKLAFGIEEEASHLQDMLLCHLSLLDILHELKVREGVHEFDDVASLAADLLLARCPRIMRADYPIEVVHALDALPDESWSDQHIHSAVALMEGFVKDPKSAGLDSKEAKRLLEDLQKRYSRLQVIRSRYRAFIIDEAQDNSAQQWRLLGRLWGQRNLPAALVAWFAPSHGEISAQPPKMLWRPDSWRRGTAPKARPGRTSRLLR